MTTGRRSEGRWGEVVVGAILVVVVVVVVRGRKWDRLRMVGWMEEEDDDAIETTSFFLVGC